MMTFFVVKLSKKIKNNFKYFLDYKFKNSINSISKNIKCTITNKSNSIQTGTI